MNKFFAVIGGLVIVVLAAIFAVPAMIDWSRYRGTFEDEASHLLGRPVRVGDHVRLQLLPSPYISFDNVRVADASGHFDTPLLRADSFRMQLAIGSLLTGSLAAQDVEINKPTLRLAIEADGRGNWIGLGGSAGDPAAGKLHGLALNAVHIDHGNLELVGAAGWRSNFNDVSGDLDAPALTGPYRFKGQVINGSKSVDVRFSANHDDKTGMTRINAVWHDTAAGTASYTLDGTIDKLDATPTLTGTVHAQLPAAEGSALALDVKSAVEANPDFAKLNGIEMLFDAGARPQRITGNAVLDWRDGSASHADLSAVWLDLDKIAGAAPGAGPLDTIRKLTGRLGAVPDGQLQARFGVRISEATIGGGTVNDVTLDARAASQGFVIENLTARLPGLSRLDAAGSLGTEGAGRFDGQVRLWGANLGALVNWAVPGAGISTQSSANTYLLDGTVAADAEHFRADPIRAEVSGTTVTGAVSYISAAPSSISVSLDSGRLDLAKLVDVPLAGAALSALLTSAATGDGKPPAAGSDALRTALSGDTHLNLRIGQLLTAQGSLHDVSAKLDRSNGRLDIPAVDLSTDGGFNLHVEGALQTKADAAEGQLRLTVSAPDAKALSEAAKFAGLGDIAASAQAGLKALTPLSLAGTMQVGGTGIDGERLQLDGSLNGSRAIVVIDRDGGDADFLGSRIDIAAELTNPDDGRLLAQLVEAAGSVLPQAAASTQPGKLVLRLSGVPRTGVITSAALDTQALHTRFDGRSLVDDHGSLGFDGALGLEAASGSTVLALTRLDKLLPAAEGPLKLSAHARRDAGVLYLDDARATASGQTLTGSASLDATSAPPQLVASLATNTIRLDKLLAVLTPGQSPAPPVPVPVPVAATGKPGVPPILPFWSEQLLSFAPLAGIAARIDTKTARLVLSDGIEVSNAALTVSTDPASLDLTLSQGRFAQGDISGHLKLDKEKAGASMVLDGKLADAGLAGLSGPSSGLPHPLGRLTLAAHLQGHGLSPRDLAAAATGAGDFSLSEGAIAAMSPLSVDAAARQTLADPAPAVVPAELEQKLDKGRFLSAFPMLGAHGAITITDGIVHFDRLKVQSSKADLEAANRVDLASLRLTSQFSLQPKSPEPDKPALPNVQFSFEGPLTDFTHVSASVEASALARDLASRKLLGGPEQMQGIWPVAPPPAPAAAADVPAASPAGDAAQSPASQPASAALTPAHPPASAAAVEPAAATTAPPAAATAAADITIAPAVVTDPATANAAATPAKAAASANRTHKKKTDWATALLQGLFGN